MTDRMVELKIFNEGQLIDISIYTFLKCISYVQQNKIFQLMAVRYGTGKDRPL